MAASGSLHPVMQILAPVVTTASITATVAPTEPPGQLIRQLDLLPIPTMAERYSRVHSGPGRPVFILPAGHACPSIGSFPAPALGAGSTSGMSPIVPI